MSGEDIESLKNLLWKRKPRVTHEYILVCILEELQNIRKESSKSGVEGK